MKHLWAFDEWIALTATQVHLRWWPAELISYRSLLLLLFFFKGTFQVLESILCIICSIIWPLKWKYFFFLNQKSEFYKSTNNKLFRKDAFN